MLNYKVILLNHPDPITMKGIHTMGELLADCLNGLDQVDVSGFIQVGNERFPFGSAWRCNSCGKVFDAEKENPRKNRISLNKGTVFYCSKCIRLGLIEIEGF